MTSEREQYNGKAEAFLRAGKSRFNIPVPASMQPPAAAPLPPGMIEMYTPESDFMELVRVKRGSPRHIQLMRDAAQMEPDGPEAQELLALRRPYGA